MVIFKCNQKKFEDDLKIKLCGKRLYPTESDKYLGVKIDTNRFYKKRFLYKSVFIRLIDMGSI